MKFKITTLIALFLISIVSFGQSTQKFIDTGSVANQFDYLVKKSGRYQDYKVVKQVWLQQLKKNVQDSLNTSRSTVKENNQKIASQQKEIDNLNIKLTNSTSEITNLNSQISTINFLGIQLKKGTFKTLLFSIIGILVLLLLFFIFKFKQSNSVTLQTKAKLKDIEEEYEEHRKRALEREQKVMRRLQDELNKQKKE
jgi:DNA mismatch repair ATPase MutS